MKDMLTEMLARQEDLQRIFINKSPADISNDVERISFISTMTLALTDELHEALNETGWKSWATSKHVNEEAFKNELVDAWHFFMNLMLVARMSPEELYIRYLRKNEKNIKRQKDGYDGLDKCLVCKRAYDDEAVHCTPKTTHDMAFCTQFNQSISSDMI